MGQHYLRTENNTIEFVVNGIHEIKKTDIPINVEEYNRFFVLQTQGKQFRLKEIIDGNGLFDHIEEYTPSVIEVIPEPGLQEIALDHEYRISKLELGV